MKREVESHGNDSGSAGRIVLGVLGGIVLALGIVWVAQGSDFFLFKVFAPKEEQVRREVFEQSKAYNEGMVQELQSMMFEYAKATPEQKDALASIILHRVAGYDVDKLPSDLREFVLQLRRERLGDKP
jgi:hypothetical protein